MIYPYPATAVLASNGIGTASVGYVSVGGFGQDFGLSFGGPTVMGPVTAALASDGTGTAAAYEVLVSAELQLV